MNTAIIVFAFNRLEAYKNTINSLLQNTESADSDLFVFVDGPRKQKVGEADKVAAVQEYVRQIKGFKSVTYTFAEVNNGLGPSIIKGVTQVINQYGSAIVLEDDLVFAPNFLSFMNQGLQHYEHNEKVFSICGYSNKVKKPNGYIADSYFCTRSSSWGWATWADRWNSVDWELKDWDKYTSLGKKFNQWGGSDCWKMLNDWKHGKNKSWAIRFCFAQFLQNKISLFPLISKVRNDGFDGDGTNCKKFNRFKYEFDQEGSKNFVLPSSTEVNPKLYKSAMAYNGLFIRIYSRIMYLLIQ